MWVINVGYLPTAADATALHELVLAVAERVQSRRLSQAKRQVPHIAHACVGYVIDVFKREVPQNKNYWLQMSAGKQHGLISRFHHQALRIHTSGSLRTVQANEAPTACKGVSLKRCSRGSLRQPLPHRSTMYGRGHKLPTSNQRIFTPFSLSPSHSTQPRE